MTNQSCSNDSGQLYLWNFSIRQSPFSQTLVIALGAGSRRVGGVINLLEGYGNDNPGAKSQGMKQLMAGAGVAIVGMVLVPLLSGLFTVLIVPR